MSLPQDRLSTTCNPGAFLPPDDVVRPSLTIDYELGGVAIGDPSQGLRVRNWVAELVGDDVVVYPESDPSSATTVYTAPDIEEVALSFDQNMNVVLGIVEDGTAFVYWFNPGTGLYVTTTLAAGSRSIRLTLDDKRRNASVGGYNDVLAFYLRGNGLYYRQQRDQYAVERLLYTYTGPPEAFIRRVGFTNQLRVAAELYDLPALPECAGSFIISGEERPVGQSVAAQQGVIGVQDPWVKLEGISLPTAMGGVSVFNPNRAVSLTGRSVSVQQGSTVVPPYPNLISSSTSVAVPTFVGNTGFVCVSYFVNGTFSVRWFVNNTFATGGQPEPWIDVNNPNYSILDIAHQYEVREPVRLSGPAWVATTISPETLISTQVNLTQVPLPQALTTPIHFYRSTTKNNIARGWTQFSIVPGATNPRAGQGSYYHIFSGDIGIRLI
jgi:hypothetical protein